jgi:hypothetical protein
MFRDLVEHRETGPWENKGESVIMVPWIEKGKAVAGIKARDWGWKPWPRAAHFRKNAMSRATPSRFRAILAY